jgi:peptidoglycan/xylan/chitin deacetylase (PgdA/CDA1 family)
MPLVLMYHSVEPYQEDPYLVTVTPERFERQMRWLRRHGLRGVSVRELLAAADRGQAGRLVGLTFDDGYEDFATRVVPTLMRYGFTATVYVIAGRIGEHNAWDPDGPRKELMTANQIRAVAAAGMEIGSHSWWHVRLPATDDLTEEVGRSRSALAEVIDADVTGFCYPYGDVDARVVRAVREAGYDYGCAIALSELTSRHALPRSYVGEKDNGLRLRAKRTRHLMRRQSLAVG